MQKLEDVVIHTQKDFKNIEIVFPNFFLAEEFFNQSSEIIYSDDSIDFLQALSKELLNEKEVKNYPDVSTFAFFCRKSNILNLKRKDVEDGVLRFGRGFLFHIAPSNVPVNFAYSLVAGILSGNLNIVRLPSKNFRQVNLIVNALNKLSSTNQYKQITSKICLIKYERNNSVNSFLSSVCDVRIIWGGDSTINEIRKSTIPPKSFDLTFPDRYSICAINADQFITEKFPQKIAQNFYNDTYLFDQNACTSPHLLMWLGTKENIRISQEVFWDNLYQLVKKKYAIQPIISVDKLTSFYIQAVNLKEIKRISTPDNLLWRVEIRDLVKGLDEYRCNSGYFLEYLTSSLEELSQIIERKYQTLSYYGIEKNDLISFINTIKPCGIDRIVPIGQTTDFSLIWDGYDLVKTLSRRIEII